MSNPQPLVNNYILSQAAVSADAYDPSAPNQTSYDTFASDLPGVPTLGPPANPDFFGDYPATGSPYFGEIGQAVSGKIINYFNAQDFALDVWRKNQNEKHRIAPLLASGYGFDGGVSGLEPVFNTPDRVRSLPTPLDQQYTLAGGQVQFGGNEDSSYELLAFAVRSHSNAVGAQSGLSLPDVVWRPEDLSDIAGFGTRSHSHSGQFNGALVASPVAGDSSDIRAYWDSVFGNIV